MRDAENEEHTHVRTQSFMSTSFTRALPAHRCVGSFSAAAAKTLPRLSSRTMGVLGTPGTRIDLCLRRSNGDARVVLATELVLGGGLVLLEMFLQVCHSFVLVVE